MTEPTTSLPSAPRLQIASSIILQPPLSRRGKGPGLILILPEEYHQYETENKSLDPEPLQKWAEESYAVVQISISSQASSIPLEVALNALESSNDCDTKDGFGLIIYGPSTSYLSSIRSHLQQAIGHNEGKIRAIIATEQWILSERIPTLLHLPGDSAQDSSSSNVSPGTIKVYRYNEASSAAFVIPGSKEYKSSASGVAHTRSLTFLKKQLNGPYFDLEKIWEEHTSFEFGDRSVEKTMATMVQEPYVNHVPTITGGIGRAELSNFYRDHFIFNNPEDTSLELVSRTIGIDRIVDEFIFCLTHTKVVDWLLPGVPPTNKPLRIPFTSVVNIRGDRLYHEHIAWDQATVLAQLGLLPTYLPFPYPVIQESGGQPVNAAPGKRFEYRVPAAGVETASKLQDERAVASNEMFGYRIREVDGN